MVIVGADINPYMPNGISHPYNQWEVFISNKGIFFGCLQLYDINFPF